MPLCLRRLPNARGAGEESLAAPSKLPECAAGGGGEAVNELIARRSTAARSANHKHFSLLPDLSGLLVCDATLRVFPLRRCWSRPPATHGRPNAEATYRLLSGAPSNERGHYVSARPARNHCLPHEHTWLDTRMKFGTGWRSAGIGIGCSAVRYSKADHTPKDGFQRPTFELSGRRRQDARPGLAKMYRVPPDRAWWPAVGAPLERGVRRHRGATSV